MVDLGDWEYCEADSGLFVMPGVYTYGKVVYDKTGVRTIKPVTKIRGGDAKKYGASVKANQMAHRKRARGLANAVRSTEAGTVPAHRRPLSEVHHGRKRVGVAPSLEAGRALDGATRRAGAATREINVHSVGNKRELIPDEICWPDYVSIPGREARRCHELIRTLPALNNDRALSRPRMPEWLDEGIGEEVEEREEQEEIRAGFE